VIVPSYKRAFAALHLTVHGDYVLRAVTHVRAHSYLYAFCLLGYVVGDTE